MHKLATGVYAETAFKGVNVGAIVAPDGILCIDTPTNPADCRKWRLKLAQFGGQGVRYVINTDHQRDRILGNQWFEAPVIAHEFVGERLRAYPEPFRAEPGAATSEALAAGDLGGILIVPPQITFVDALTLMKGNREIHLAHRPGASPGAVWAHLPAEGILFTGDSVTIDAVPYLGEADLETWIEELNAVLRKRFPAKVIVPGRGPLTDKKGLADMLAFLRDARRKIKQMAARRGPPDASAAVPRLLDYFDMSDSERDYAARRFKAGLERLVAQERGEAAA
jgi:cyclase